jgi:hypothetical protein
MIATDLGKIVAINMARTPGRWSGRPGPVRPGRAEARLGAGVHRKQAPPYVALPALAVTHENAGRLKQVYHEDPPQNLQSSFVAGN